MKKILLPLIFCVIALSTVTAQITQKIKRSVQVLPQQTFYLADGMSARSGEQSRINYTIELPANTIEWYYMITTSEGKVGSKALYLKPKLTDLLKYPIDVTTINVPAGSNPCNVYLMNKENAEAFLNKVDNSGGTYRYLSSGTRENLKDGVVQIKDAIVGTYYLGIKNPSASKGITIDLEVTAIVEELVENNTEWVATSKENLYNTYYKGLQGERLEEAEAKDLANCLVEKITVEKTPGQYYAMSENEKDSFLAVQFKSCAAKYEDVKGSDYEKATNFANLGWKAYENGNIERCIEFSKKALELDSSLGLVKATLGLCYLIKNDRATATSYYMESLNDSRKLKLNSQRKEYLRSVLKDLENALKKYPAITGSEEIRRMYDEELKKY